MCLVPLLVVPFVQPGWAAPASPADGPILEEAHETVLEANGGKVRALAYTQIVTFKDAQGRPVPTPVRGVAVFTNNLLWIGAPTPNVVVLPKKVVGVYVVGNGGLYLGVSSNVFTPKGTRPQAADLAAFLRNTAERVFGQAKDDTRISLRDLVGDENLGDMRLAIIPEPAIKAVSVQGQEIVVTLKSANDKVIVLIVNEGLQPVRASVDGKVVWEKRGSPTKP